MIFPQKVETVLKTSLNGISFFAFFLPTVPWYIYISTYILHTVMIVMISWPIIMSSNFFTSFSIIDHLKATISKTAISLKRHNRWLFFEAMISLEVIRLCDVLRESLDIDPSIQCTPVIMHIQAFLMYYYMYICM